MSTVCIIGAGAAGLVSIKSCLEQQLIPTCFELNDNIGGVWYYSDHVRYKQGASVYKNLTANTPANFTAFSNFPFPQKCTNYSYPQKCPIFPSHEHYLQYLHDYAKNYSLYNFIVFNIEVVHVNFDLYEGKWRVETRHVNKTGPGCEYATEHFETNTYFFDFVMVCTGALRTPFIPEFEGAYNFEGRIMHSNQFKDGCQFKGQKVIVIGGGEFDKSSKVEYLCSDIVLSAVQKKSDFHSDSS